MSLNMHIGRVHGAIRVPFQGQTRRAAVLNSGGVAVLTAPRPTKQTAAQRQAAKNEYQRKYRERQRQLLATGKATAASATAKEQGAKASRYSNETPAERKKRLAYQARWRSRRKKAKLSAKTAQDTPTAETPILPAANANVVVPAMFVGTISITRIVPLGVPNKKS